MLLIGIASGGGSDEASDEPADRAEKPKEAAKPRSAKQRVSDALAEKGTANAKVSEFGKALTIEAKTPETLGDVDGGDFDRHAQEIFHAVYGDANYNAQQETVIVFKGGLVDAKTGKPLRGRNASIYTMKRREAKQIAWDDEDAMFNVRWSLYRDFLHPAFR